MNLTKLLSITKNLYEGKYGDTSWVGNLINGTSETDCYGFELEIREVEVRRITECSSAGRAPGLGPGGSSVRS